MKKLISLSLLLIVIVSVSAKSINILQENQDSLTATVNKSTRLFGSKDDLTTVIVIIPKGSIVTVLGSDSTYLNVVFEENEGYIFSKHATQNKPIAKAAVQQEQKSVQKQQVPQSQEISRFEYLENKYGTSMASKLYSGKIWRGMSTDMAQDSWGNARKINRVISGNEIKEEWIYNNNWLYFENNELIEWGATK